MKRYLADPVLSLTVSGLHLLRWLTWGFAAVSLLCLALAALTAAVTANEVLKPDELRFVLTLFPVAFITFVLIALFLGYLRDIILSVGDEQPLTIINAKRLRSMGWLVLGLQAITLVLIFALGPRYDMSLIDVDEIFGLVESIVVAAVLFILARVFEQGARMREELEGTV